MKKLISRKVLQTELSMICKLIDELNFGDAKKLACRVNDRVMEYDMVSPKNKVLQISTNFIKGDINERKR